jgi:hypothetical protein
VGMLSRGELGVPMCATQLFVIYAKHTKTTKSTTKTVIKLVNHAATSLVLLPNTHTPFWFSCGHLAWFSHGHACHDAHAHV